MYKYINIDILLCSVALFVAILLPVTWRWADQLKEEQREYLLELLPWKIFLFLHRTILLTTFLGKPLYYFDILEDGVHIISIFFRVFTLTWLVTLVLYVGYGVAIFPWKAESRQRKDSEKDEMVTGIVTTSVYSYPPNSELVSGISGWHFAFKQEESPATTQGLKDEVEQKGNAVLHRRFRAVCHELC